MIPRKTHSQLEAIAETFLAKHGKFDGRALMVDLTVQVYGYEVWPIRGLGQFAEGFVPNKPGLIFVDEGQMLEQPQRFRFTLAEELAHILIHVPSLKGKSIEDLQRFWDSMRASQYRAYEHDAKYLAACLLMPKAGFIERFKAHSAVQAERVSNRTKVLRYTARQVAMDFCVSPAAVTQRALKLRLISDADATELAFL